IRSHIETRSEKSSCIRGESKRSPAPPSTPGNARVRLAVARFTVITFGCQMNSHDSERIGEVLRGAGHTEAAGLDDADLVLLNTCSIREKAEQKLRSEVGRIALLKRKRPELTIAVAGCLAQQEGA